MSKDHESVEDSGRILSRRELLGASATLGTAALASATPGVGSVSSQATNEPRIALGSDYAIDDNPDGNGDFVVEHLPSASEFRYDSAKDEWAMGSLSASYLSVSKQLTSVSLSADQAIGSKTMTKVQWDNVVEDEMGAFDSSNHDIKVQETGKYLFTAFVRWNNDTGWSTGDLATIRPFVNGNQEFVPQSLKIGTDTQGVSTPPTVLSLSSGDTLDVRAYQNSGAGKSLDGGTRIRSRFNVSRVG